MSIQLGSIVIKVQQERVEDGLGDVDHQRYRVADGGDQGTTPHHIVKGTHADVVATLG